MTTRIARPIVTGGLLALFCGAAPASAQTVGNAQSFAIVGGQAVNANGVGSVVNGDVGISPAAATFITGFPGFPPNQTGGIVSPPFAVRGNDASAIAAEASSDALYNSSAMAPAGGTVTLPALSTGGPTANGHFVPGKYVLGGIATATITTSITLDGAGTYVFSFPTNLTTSVASTVILNGVNPCDVWWRVPTGAALDGLNLPGNVVSNATIALGSGATVNGRLLTTANGSVTLAGTDTISGCSIPRAVPTPTPRPNSCASTAPDLFITKTHSGSFVVGTNASYSIALGNNGVTSVGPITVTDTLPSGVAFVSASGPTWTCSAAGQVVTCTSTSTLPGLITLTVTPGVNAVPSVVNNATVSGGGDCDVTNNSASDTAVVAVAVPTLPEWALLMMAVLLTASGVFALRRRVAGSLTGRSRGGK